MSEVRLRFPPSPTGYLHIGGARTAIYNWLYARKHGGKLILRIEDTDVERSTQGSIDGIIEGLEWLGIDWDEGPYFQTEFAGEHVAAANRLIAEGHAYKCFCTKEELDAKREAALAAKQEVKYDGACRNLTPEQVAEKEAAGIPAVVRFKVPDRQGKVGYNDKVLGRIEQAYSEISDFVIVRSNGKPLYLLCNVVDDIRDRISHIIRGQDHKDNTNRQILLYEALGAPIPVFAHMPLTMDIKGAKISKRSHGEIVAVQFYKKNGFLPWALVNFLVLLGWNPGDDREIFSKEELIEAFTLERINKSSSIFNHKKDDPKFFTDPKAININAHYLRAMPVAELAVFVKKELVEAGIWDDAYEHEKKEWFCKVLELSRERFHTLKDFATLGRAYFADDFAMDEQALNKNVLKHPELKELLPILADRFAALDPFDQQSAEQAARDFAEENGLKVGIPVNASRALITGQVKGPSMFELFELMGQEVVVSRLKNVTKYF
ncbi:MAG: glutamate--tRNA ligase [Desulfobulbaceae bacterium]|nr:glutamate--tRNA ligase [Desulfobulbaceae bacterium]HIJ78099.1 glutamate--tRNA ligase [Deltaproteobacteria bacterium]